MVSELGGAVKQHEFMVIFVDCLKNRMNRLKLSYAWVTVCIFGVFVNGMKFYDDMLLNL